MSIVLLFGGGTPGRDGLPVVEWKQDKKAEDEMNQLYKEVYGGGY